MLTSGAASDFQYSGIGSIACTHTNEVSESSMPLNDPFSFIFAKLTTTVQLQQAGLWIIRSLSLNPVLTRPYLAYYFVATKKRKWGFSPLQFKMSMKANGKAKGGAKESHLDASHAGQRSRGHSIQPLL